MKTQTALLHQMYIFGTLLGTRENHISIPFLLVLTLFLDPQLVTNPQTAFGVGSGTENDSTLGFTAEISQHNYIYVRVLNQGGINRN